MVEVGELTVLATMNTASLDAGFNRISGQLKETETQSTQLNATTRKTKGLFAGLTKTMIGFGIAGVTAITALAIKSPVLAGTMAKIGVETLKLSNVLGRQLKPIFDEIGQNLIPAISKAFADGNTIMSNFTDNAVLLLEALSALLGLDFSTFFVALDKLSSPLGLPPPGEGETPESLGITDPFRETKQRFKNLIDFPDTIKEAITGTSSIFTPIGSLVGIQKLFLQALADSLQWGNNKINEKEATYAYSNGVQHSPGGS